MNRKFVSKSNLVLSKILNSNNCLDILKDFIETILKVKIKNITLNNPKENKYYSSTTYYSMGIVEVRIQTEDEELNVGIQIIDGNYVQNKMFLYYARVHTR